MCYRKTPRSHNPLPEQPRFPGESSRTNPIETCTHLFVPLCSTRKDSNPLVSLRRSESFRASARQQSNSTAKKAAHVDSTTSRQKQGFRRNVHSLRSRPGTGCPASRCRRSIWVATPRVVFLGSQVDDFTADAVIGVLLLMHRIEGKE